MKRQTIMTYIVIFICCSTLLSACSLFIKKSEIIPTIESDNLIFDFQNKDFDIIYYEINSLEEYQSDGLTYKTILKKGHPDDIDKIVVTKYKAQDIVDNHAYYLLIVKSGTVFQTLGFCINDKLVYVQKNQKDNSGFINSCHNFNSK